VILKADGTLAVTGSGNMAGQITDHVNSLKRGYAGQVIQASARKFGWNVKQTEANKFQLVRRY